MALSKLHANSLCCKAAASDKSDKVIPEPSFNIPGTLITIAVLSALVDNKVLAGLSGILGIFLAIQANRVQFVFDKEALVRRALCACTVDHERVHIVQPRQHAFYMCECRTR